jgi:hypothetical protein
VALVDPAWHPDRRWGLTFELLVIRLVLRVNGTVELAAQLYQRLASAGE